MQCLLYKTSPDSLVRVPSDKKFPEKIYKQMKTVAIIPAGGKGARSGAAAPKQYLKFLGKELIVYTLEVFQQNKQ